MARGTVLGCKCQIPAERPAGVDRQTGAGQAAEAERHQLRCLCTSTGEADPRQWRFASAPYPREMAGEQIRRQFGIRLRAVSVKGLLRRLRPSPQRPLRQAWQAGPAAAARSLAKELPAIRAHLCLGSSARHFRRDCHSG
jgi:hypothetical protein